MVYSTNPDFEYQSGDAEEEETPDRQELKVSLDKKARAGKAVTLVTGFVGSDLAIQMLGKELKSLCGVGGTTKDGQILIQGDFRDKVLQYLISQGHRAKKAGG